MLNIAVDSYYAKSHVLQAAKLEVGDDEIVALLGRNGAGKTTLLKSVMGLVVTDGTVTFDGTELLGLPTYLRSRRGIGYVPEHRGIFGKLTTEQNLLISERGSGEWQRSDIYEMFPRLEERRNSLGKHLSGGEQQMLALGRALLGSPSLLLLDEPSQGLAPIVARSIFDTLDTLHARGVAVLLVEQNVKAALSLSARVYVLDSGRIVYSGAKDDLLEEPEIIERYIGLRADGKSI